MSKIKTNILRYAAVCYNFSGCLHVSYLFYSLEQSPRHGASKKTRRIWECCMRGVPLLHWWSHCTGELHARSQRSACQGWVYLETTRFKEAAPQEARSRKWRLWWPKWVAKCNGESRWDGKVGQRRGWGFVLLNFTLLGIKRASRPLRAPVRTYCQRHFVVCKGLWCACVAFHRLHLSVPVQAELQWRGLLQEWHGSHAPPLLSWTHLDAGGAEPDVWRLVETARKNRPQSLDLSWAQQWHEGSDPGWADEEFGSISSARLVHLGARMVERP